MDQSTGFALETFRLPMPTPAWRLVQPAVRDWVTMTIENSRGQTALTISTNPADPAAAYQIPVGDIFRVGSCRVVGTDGKGGWRFLANRPACWIRIRPEDIPNGVTAPARAVTVIWS